MAEPPIFKSNELLKSAVLQTNDLKDILDHFNPMLCAPNEQQYYMFEAETESSEEFKARSELELRWIQMLPYLNVDALELDRQPASTEEL